MKEDLVCALKNSLERGVKLQEAMQSLVSAGYDIREVQDASRELNVNILEQFKETTNSETQTQQTFTQNQTAQNPIQNASQQGQKAKSRMPIGIIILIIIIIILLLGLAAFFFYGQEIMDFIFPKT